MCLSCESGFRGWKIDRFRPVADGRFLRQTALMETRDSCLCLQLEDLAVVGMGGPNGFGGRVFSTLKEVRKHGGPQWWLYASTCSACGQGWMIAQDDRVHDNFIMRRIESKTIYQIVKDGDWPDYFQRCEEVLRIESKSGKVAHFLNPQDPALFATAYDLRCERPDISIEDIAFALAISTESARHLLP